MRRRDSVVMCANFSMRVESGGRERIKTREKLRRGGKERAEERKAGKKREKVKSVELFCILSQRPRLGDRLLGDGGNEPHSADPALCQITSRPGVLKLGDLWTLLHY